MTDIQPEDTPGLTWYCAWCGTELQGDICTAPHDGIFSSTFDWDKEDGDTA